MVEARVLRAADAQWGEAVHALVVVRARSARRSLREPLRRRAWPRSRCPRRSPSPTRCRAPRRGKLQFAAGSAVDPAPHEAPRVAGMRALGDRHRGSRSRAPGGRGRRRVVPGGSSATAPTRRSSPHTIIVACADAQRSMLIHALERVRRRRRRARRAAATCVQRLQPELRRRQFHSYPGHARVLAAGAAARTATSTTAVAEATYSLEDRRRRAPPASRGQPGMLSLSCSAEGIDGARRRATSTPSAARSTTCGRPRQQAGAPAGGLGRPERAGRALDDRRARAHARPAACSSSPPVPARSGFPRCR